MSTKTEATIEDLYYVPDNAKAELIDGEIVPMAPTGYLPGYAAGEIFSSLSHDDSLDIHPILPAAREGF